MVEARHRLNCSFNGRVCGRRNGAPCARVGTFEAIENLIHRAAQAFFSLSEATAYTCNGVNLIRHVTRDRHNQRLLGSLHPRHLPPSWISAIRARARIFSPSCWLALTRSWISRLASSRFMVSASILSSMDITSSVYRARYTLSNGCAGKFHATSSSA